MATSGELEVFSQIAHVIEEMLEGETGAGRLALPFARRSTRRFREGNFDGGFESFLYAKSMLMFAQEDPVYAQDFFDYLAEEGALGLEVRDINGKGIELHEHIREVFEERQHGQCKQGHEHEEE